MNKYLSVEEKILYVCRCEYMYFLRKSNVVAVGLGYKIINGFDTHKKCIKVFVTNKKSQNQLIQDDVIPRMYKNLLTDIVSTDVIRPSKLIKKIRPVLGGYSIGSVITLGSGTMACLVTDGKKHYVLGNNHVIANENHASIGSSIVQPGVEDGGKSPQDTIAVLSKYIKLKFTTSLFNSENFVDCAIAEVVNPTLVSPKLAILGNIKGTEKAKLDELVQKVGRSTELTVGKIVAVGTTVTTDFEKEKCIFKDQIATTSMSQKGDSGALLVDLNEKAVGLLFSEGKSNSFFNPIQKVLKVLGVSIVTK